MSQRQSQIYLSAEAKKELKRRPQPSEASMLDEEGVSNAAGVSARVLNGVLERKRQKSKGKSAPGKRALAPASPVMGGGMLSSSFAKSLLDPRTVYKFRLIDFNSFASSGAGVLSGYISCDPATTSFSEWSSLINLFTEVRLVAARVHICNVNPHSDGYATGQIKSDIAMNYNDLSVATAPSSVLATLDNAHSWLHPLGKSSATVYSAMVSKNRQFANTATPSPGPYAGCTGQFSFYQTALTASTTYFDYFLECEFEFRNRD